jgi:transposase-like protein
VGRGQPSGRPRGLGARGQKSVLGRGRRARTANRRWWVGACALRCNEGTLGNWVRQYRASHAGEEPPLSITERARLRELEKENRELKMKVEFLGKAAAFVAQESR